MYNQQAAQSEKLQREKSSTLNNTNSNTLNGEAQIIGSTKIDGTNASVSTIDQRLIIDDSHSPSYQDFLATINDYCPHLIDSAIYPSKGIQIKKTDVHFDSSDFIPFQLGRDSLVETAVNELAPIDTDLPVQPTPVVHFHSDYIRKNLPIQFKVNAAQWNGIGTMQLNGQGDTGANTSATNNLSIIHDYRPYKTPQSVSVFLDEKENATQLTADGTGYINIISDQGNIMQWKVVYTPKSN